MDQNYKNLLTHALTEILPSTGVLTQVGATWVVAKPIAGMESFGTRSFSSQAELIDAIATYYVQKGRSGSIQGFQAQPTSQAPQTVAAPNAEMVNHVEGQSPQDLNAHKQRTDLERNQQRGEKLADPRATQHIKKAV